MQEFTLSNDNAEDIKFSGDLIGSALSSEDKAGSGYSGSAGRWVELNIYKTSGGKFVCQEIGHTKHDGERTRHKVAISETIDDVKAFFGYRWLAKELYRNAGIDAAKRID